MSRFLLSCLLVASLLATACSGTTKSTGPVVLDEQDLPTLTLQPSDLPKGFNSVETRFIPTDLLATSMVNTEEVRAQLEGWGRLMGYRSSVSASRVSSPRAPTRVTSDVEQYANAIGARDRVRGFDPVRDLAIAGEAVTETRPPNTLLERGRSFRMFMREDGAERIVYITIFSRGPLVSIITTSSERHRDDNGLHANRFSHLVDERMEDILH